MLPLVSLTLLKKAFFGPILLILAHIFLLTTFLPFEIGSSII